VPDLTYCQMHMLHSTDCSVQYCLNVHLVLLCICLSIIDLETRKNHESKLMHVH